MSMWLLVWTWCGPNLKVCESMIPSTFLWGVSNILGLLLADVDHEVIKMHYKCIVIVSDHQGSMNPVGFCGTAL